MQPLDRLDGFDLGGWIWREYWNRGLATEAAIASCDDALGRAGAQRLYRLHRSGQPRLPRRARKLGMRGIGRMKAGETGSWRNDAIVEVYELTRADWLNRTSLSTDAPRLRYAEPGYSAPGTSRMWPVFPPGKAGMRSPANGPQRLR